MALAVSNFSKNILQIENLDLSNPALYTISVLNDEGTFVPALNQPTDPTTILAAGAIVNIDLINDSVYVLTLAGTPNILYYFLMDANLKKCGKTKMEEILCDTCGEKDMCGKQAHILKVESLIKYSAIKQNLYWIWSEFVEDQAINDILVADNGKLLMLSDLVKKLNLICDNCQSDDICANVYDSNNNSTGNCGCSK